MGSVRLMYPDKCANQNRLTKVGSLVQVYDITAIAAISAALTVAVVFGELESDSGFKD